MTLAPPLSGPLPRLHLRIPPRSHGRSRGIRRPWTAQGRVNVTGVTAACFVHRDSGGRGSGFPHPCRGGEQGPDPRRALAGHRRPGVVQGEGGRRRRPTTPPSNCHLHNALGVRFAERPGTDPGKRPFREIVGVDPDFDQRWSTRRRQASTSAAANSPSSSRPTTAGHPPRSKHLQLAQQANLGKPATPNTNPALKPTNARSGWPKRPAPAATAEEPTTLNRMNGLLAMMSSSAPDLESGHTRIFLSFHGLPLRGDGHSYGAKMADWCSIRQSCESRDEECPACENAISLGRWSSSVLRRAAAHGVLRLRGKRQRRERRTRRQHRRASGQRGAGNRGQRGGRERRRRQ